MPTMSKLRRQIIFASSMILVVTALNIALILLDGNGCCEEEHLGMIISIVAAGYIAMGVSAFLVCNGIFGLEEGRIKGAMAGAITVLISYPLLIPSMIFTMSLLYLINAELFATPPTPSMVFIFGFGAMIGAFTISAWIAVPIGAVVGSILAKPIGTVPRLKLGANELVRGIVYSTSIGIASYFVFERVQPGVVSQQADWWQMGVFVSIFSSIVGFGIWCLVMSSGQSKSKGAVVGVLTALAAVLTSGPVITLVGMLQSGGFHPGVAIFSASIISFFALFLALTLAIPAATAIGFIAAKSG